MKTNMYALFDSAAKTFLQPMYVLNDGIAIRAIMDIVNSEEKNNVNQHPEQFTLFHIGSWDDNNGKVESIDSVAKHYV